jgi:hypothetical protein
VLLVGCSASETVAPAIDASAPESARASASCEDFLGALDRTVTQFAYLKVSVGSDLDETERLATLEQYTATMAADASECAPEAAAALTTLRDETITLAEAYVPNADGAVAEGIYSILVDIRAAGEQAWTQMGRPRGDWRELPLREDGSTVQ